MSELAGRNLGPYEVVREIARGGQGVVLEARDTRLHRTVALKILGRRGATVQKRFRNEARVLANVSHPNLPRVFESGELDGITFMAMELIAGRSLERVVEEDGPRAGPWIGVVLAPVAEALQRCHEAGVIHRDIKPANIIVEDGTGRPVLVDFGVAKLEGDALDFASHPASLSGELKGTPSFMAPEQADRRRSAVSPATDVYALGGTLYFLLTGHPPVEGTSLVSALAKLLGETPTDPLALNPTASPGLSALAMWALEKEPARRPASAAAFADELRARVAAPAAGSASRRRSLIVLALAGAGLIVGLVAGLGVPALRRPTGAPAAAGPPAPSPRAPAPSPQAPAPPGTPVDDAQSRRAALERAIAALGRDGREGRATVAREVEHALAGGAVGLPDELVRRFVTAALERCAALAERGGSDLEAQYEQALVPYRQLLRLAPETHAPAPLLALALRRHALRDALPRSDDAARADARAAADRFWPVGDAGAGAVALQELAAARARGSARLAAQIDLDRMRILLHLGRHAEAVQVGDAALRADPSEATVAVKRAEALKFERGAPAAILALDEVLARDPLDGDARLCRGRLRVDLPAATPDDLRLAEIDLRLAADDLRPTRLPGGARDPLWLVAVLEERRGAYAAALAACEEARRVHRSDGHWSTMVHARMLVRCARVEDAARLLEESGRRSELAPRLRAATTEAELQALVALLE